LRAREMSVESDGLAWVSGKLFMAVKHRELNSCVEVLRYYGGWTGKFSGKTIEVGSGRTGIQFTHGGGTSTPEFAGKVCVHPAGRAHWCRWGYCPSKLPP